MVQTLPVPHVSLEQVMCIAVHINSYIMLARFLIKKSEELVSDK